MAQVVAVSAKAAHGVRKDSRTAITLIAGRGVEGDAHCGTEVKHRSRASKNPEQANLRQVHFIHAELFDELAAQGFAVAPGEMGENVTTRGIDLLALPEGAVLALGGEARVRVTGLRNPCHQLNEIAPGLMDATLDRAPDGVLIRKAGVMAVVIADGEVRAGDAITVELSVGLRRALAPV
ncbi:MAG: MOSC domain-containing protein [Sphingomonadaceae bacterium]|nr:MOSC domain-containing protein [Sphingomonadaceae bacterium]